MNGTVWVNGVLGVAEEAAISPFDHGMTVGNGVFETMVCESGRPFAFSRHYQRLLRSAETMGLRVRGQDELWEASLAVIRANNLEETRTRLRITVTGGPAPLGSERGEDTETTLVAAGPTPSLGEFVDVAIVPYTRNETGALAGVKSTSYGENVLALAEAKAAGAGEAIFGNTKGQLCEGTGSNVFLVRDGEVVTPPLASGCLAGVTRALVLELCEREGISAAETDLPLEALRDAEEAFLTSTTRDVQPIRRVDSRELPLVPGEVTAKLRRAFRAMAEAEIDP